MELAGRRGGEVALGAVLGLASVAELAARLTAGSTVRAGLAAGAATHSGVSVPTALLMCAFCLLATVPAPLLRPVPAAVTVCVASVLPQLGDLVDEAREASGSAARLIVSGQVTQLDPGVELAAYRIVQEALTNARRHAPGAAVDVELRYADDLLRVRVRDNGPGPAGPAAKAADPGPSAGHGLLGMRERAAAAGGWLRTTAAAGGGFCVEAELPAQVPDVMTGAGQAS